MNMLEREKKQQQIVRSEVIVATIRWIIYSTAVAVVPLILATYYEIPGIILKYGITFFELLGMLFYIQAVDYIVTDEFY